MKHILTEFWFPLTRREATNCMIDRTTALVEMECAGAHTGWRRMQRKKWYDIIPSVHGDAARSQWWEMDMRRGEGDKKGNKGRHGTDPWPTPWWLDIFPTPQRLQNMPFIAYGGALPSAGLGHVYSCLFNEMCMSHPPKGWPHDHGPTNVGAMVKRDNKW